MSELNTNVESQEQTVEIVQAAEQDTVEVVTVIKTCAYDPMTRL